MAHGIPTLETRNWKFKKKVQTVGHFIREPSRFYLEEFFKQTPALNAVLTAAFDNADATNASNVTITTARNVANKDFEVAGDNMTTALVTFSTTVAGITLTTDTTDNDSAYICPHLDTKQTAWTNTLWGTENQVIWEAAIKTDTAVLTTLLWAGLKLTQDPTIATDDNQVYFRYDTDVPDTNWQCITSIAGVDTTTDSGVTVSGATVYLFRIEIDSDRKAHFYIDDVLVHSTTALTNDIDLIPYIGVQALMGAARSVLIGYEKISRTIYE